ncbi:MAG: CpsD/CapB family tyrosine-protein kinase [Pseudomonadota bacterium]|uniref:CpsD/CapB family tyrosine-protein kinase n=1 Tax=Roseovarius salincola TaxID=2978479 RepID=UPI0022A71074|nr:CpsD/CapB family tyrosine-protein kinase [Roseovarius sp. EGI FJ00037]MCZ0811233.1 CpsD/CapB family tyrosine-protein kinase [Roseovarius sp. EGI FJ00037]
MERIQAALKKARESRTEQGREKPDTQVKSRGDSKNNDTLILHEDMALGDRDETWKAIKSFQPSERLLNRNRIISFRACPESVPYDVMRTKLLQKMRSKNWTRIAITSPTAGAGKTMTCINLAFSLSRQSDIHSMLLELDMRRPSMARMLGLKGSCQLARALAGDEAPEKHMRRYGKNLIFGSNRAPERNPAELLQGSRSAHVVDEIEAQFRPDIMIFDTPPLFAGDDTMAFLDQVDCALLIAEAEKSTIEDIDKSEQELAARTNVLGVVLNKCRYLSRHEEYGKEYGY